MSQMCIDRHVKYLLFLLVLITFYFSRQIFEKYSNIEFMNIFPVAAELFHAEGRKEERTGGHEEAISRISKFF